MDAVTLGILMAGGGGSGGSGTPVSGSTPSVSGTGRYVCTADYVTELTITPPESGEVVIVFTSGTTPTVISGLSGVTMPDWWNGVEANRIYEISIADGLAVVTSWAT